MIVFTLTAAPLHAADPGADALLARLARPAPDSTSFVEVRYSSLLDQPIVVSGHLEHRKDGSLVRNVEWPYQEVTELHGENVSVTRAGSKTRRFTLDRAPELRGMLTSFGAILQGDRQTLDRYFAASAEGSDAHWEITLTPRDDKLRRHLSRIVVNGVEGNAKCFTLEEPDGDASLMALGVTGQGALPASRGRAALHAWCTNGNRQ